MDTRSRGTNSRLPFDINVKRNLSIFCPRGNFITLQSADWMFYFRSEKIVGNLPGASKVPSFQFWRFHGYVPRSCSRIFTEENRNHAIINNFDSLGFLSPTQPFFVSSALRRQLCSRSTFPTLLFETWNKSTVSCLWLGELWLNKQRNALSILTGRRNAEPVYSGVTDNLANNEIATKKYIS